MINVGIVGSRQFDDAIAVKCLVMAMPIAFHPHEFCIVSGGAAGVDTWAEEEARDMGIEIKPLRADWKRYKKGAGILRNMVLVDQCDFLFIFWNGKSPGTRHVISYARKQDVPFRIIREGELWKL